MMTEAFAALDSKYGVARMPLTVHGWETNKVPRSICEFSESVAKRMSDVQQLNDCNLFKHAARTITYIWVMNDTGEVRVAVEELAELPDGQMLTGHPRRRGFPVHPAEEKKLGHPTLVGCGAARIAGELFLDEVEDGTLQWHVNDNSGRYCKVSAPNKNQKENVHEFFKKFLGDKLVFDELRKVV